MILKQLLTELTNFVILQCAEMDQALTICILLQLPQYCRYRINGMVIIGANFHRGKKKPIIDAEYFRKLRHEFASSMATATSASQATSKRY